MLVVTSHYLVWGLWFTNRPSWLQGSFDYLFLGDQRIQIYGNLEGNSLITIIGHCLGVGNWLWPLVVKVLVCLLFFFSEERMQDPYEEVGTKKMAEEMPNPKNWGKLGGWRVGETFRSRKVSIHFIAGNPWFVPKPHLTRKRVTLCGTCVWKHIDKHVGQENRMNA